MNKLLVIILVAFFTVSVLSRSIKVSSENDDEDDESEEESDESDDEDQSEENDNINMSCLQYKQKFRPDLIHKVAPPMNPICIPRHIETFVCTTYTIFESTQQYKCDPRIMMMHDLHDDASDADSDQEDDGGGIGWKAENSRWPKEGDKVIVPYEIGDMYKSNEVKNIKEAMRRIELETGCIKYRKRNNEKDYVSITMEAEGCYADIGRKGKKQLANIDHDCAKEVGEMMHEFVHTLGFGHMHSHPKRDDYVEIEFDNIKPEAIMNFKRYKAEDTLNFDTGYDYLSIMHYNVRAYSKNGLPTIIPHEDGMEKRIGQRKQLSPGDIIRIQKMYDCPVTVMEEEGDSDEEESDSENDETNEDDDSDDGEN